MIASEREFKRLRPLLGTFFEIALSGTSAHDNVAAQAVEAAFTEASHLQDLFSSFTAQSTLSRLNRASLDVSIAVEREFYVLLQQALKIWRESKGAFNPFFPGQLLTSCTPYLFFEDNGAFQVQKKIAVHLNLNGIAKGYIVDQIADILKLALPGISATINAGGDLRFLNTPNKVVNLRLGNANAPVMRTLLVQEECLCSSSLSVSLTDENSSSCYDPKLRGGLTADHTVSTIADSCCLADALTKVGLYGSPNMIEHCARVFQTQFLVFDPSGSLVESYGVNLEANATI